MSDPVTITEVWPPERRPLRDIFPTSNGHRLQPCPACGHPTPRARNGEHTCHNAAAHALNEEWEFYRNARSLTW